MPSLRRERTGNTENQLVPKRAAWLSRAVECAVIRPVISLSQSRRSRSKNSGGICARRAINSDTALTARINSLVPGYLALTVANQNTPLTSLKWHTADSHRISCQNIYYYCSAVRPMKVRIEQGRSRTSAGPACLDNNPWRWVLTCSVRFSIFTLQSSSSAKPAGRTK